MDNQKPKRWLTARQLCERFHRVPRTIDRWVEWGILPPPVQLRPKGPRLFDEDEVEARERAALAARKPEQLAEAV